jgi:hypothetical protein
MEVKNMKKTPYLVAITLFIAGLMMTSTGVVGTLKNNITQKTNVGIPISDVAATEATMPLKKMPTAPSTPIDTLSRGTDTLIFASENTNQNPAIATDGLGDILVFTEDTDGLTTNLFGRWSTDSGTTWIDDSGVSGWQFPTKPTLPELDYFGSGRQAWGTMVPGFDESGTAYYIGLPDITDPLVANPNNPDGWSAWTVDWSASQLVMSNLDSADVACYSNASHIPSPEFFGVVALTADNAYPGWEQDNTLMFSYFVAGGSSQIIFFNMDTEDVFNVKTDIDQTNGKLYIVMDYENSATLNDGSEIMYTTITTNPNWWQSGWGGKYFEGVLNTDIIGDHNNCYIVGEVDNAGQRDIVCLHSSNGGSSFTQSSVTSELASETNPTVTLAQTEEGVVLVCSYVRDGDLYISTSSNGGATWAEQANPINDVAGTVVDQYNTASLDGSYVVWTDSRNTPTEIYFDTTVAPLKNPVLDITSIKGGTKISATVSNTGDAAATNVEWTMKVTGGILKRINKTYTDTIPTLAVAGQETIQSTGLILGLGPIVITISATCDEGASKQVSIQGKVLILFIKI